MNKNNLYQKINIPNWNAIQAEVLKYFNENPDQEQKNNKEDYFVHIPLSSLPVTKNFLESKALLEINECSVYFVPAHFKTKIHIDGLKKDNGKVPKGMTLHHQYVLIIPIENSNNSVNYWYRNEDVHDNMERIHNHIRKQFPYNFFVSFVKDNVEEPMPIGSVTLDKPTFIKSNIYHRVDNSMNNNIRKVLVIRFKELDYYDSLDYVFQYKDLL